MKYIKNTILLTVAATAQLSASTTFMSADSVSVIFAMASGSTQPQSNGTPEGIINGAGLAVPVSSLTSANISTTTHSWGFNALNQVLRTDAGTLPVSMTADFTFSSATEVSGMHVWNFSQGTAIRGMSGYEVFLNTGSGFGSTADFTGTLAQATSGNHVSQEIAFGSSQSVIGVRIVGGPAAGANGIGLDEVVFSNTVPEPSSAALLGLGSLGLLLRRKRA